MRGAAHPGLGKGLELEGALEAGAVGGEGPARQQRRERGREGCLVCALGEVRLHGGCY